jgi:hypothetical protein
MLLKNRFDMALRAEGYSPHEAARIAGILAPVVQPARVEALMRVLVRSGDVSPYAARRVRAALGLPAVDERGGDGDE